MIDRISIEKCSDILKQLFLFLKLIFTNQPNLVIDSGAHPSLRTNCHHQII